MIGAANPFGRSKASSCLDQVVAKRASLVSIWTLGSHRHHQRAPAPVEARYRLDVPARGHHVASIRRQLVLVLEWLAGPPGKGALAAKRWFTVLDSQETALHRVSARAERARLSVENPFPGEVGH